MKYIIVTALALVAWNFREELQLKLDRVTYEYRYDRDSIRLFSQTWSDLTR